MKQLIIVALSAILFISGINSLENDPKAMNPATAVPMISDSKYQKELTL